MEPTRISASEAKERFDSDPEVTFIDTRSDEAWSKSDAEIPGSIRSSLNTLEQHLTEIPHGRPIITYCT